MALACHIGLANRRTKPGYATPPKANSKTASLVAERSYSVTISVARFLINIYEAVAERARFELARPFSLPAFQASALDQAMRPLHKLYGERPTYFRSQSSFSCAPGMPKALQSLRISEKQSRNETPHQAKYGCRALGNSIFPSEL